MPVALRGYTALTHASPENKNLAIPGAAQAGDLALIWAFNPDGRGPRVGGWTYLDRDVWWRYLTASDIAAGSVPITGMGSAMVVVSGAAGAVRSRRSRASLDLPAGGAAFWIAFMSPYASGNPTSSAKVLGSMVTDHEGWKHQIAFATTATAGRLDLDATNSRADVYSFSITPPAAPLAPVVVSPANLQNVDQTLPLPIRFQHQGQMPMDTVRVGLRWALPGVDWQWVQADGTLTAGGASPVDLINSSGEVVLDGGEAFPGGTYELQVFTHDVTGWSPGSPIRSVVFRVPPTNVATLTTAAEDLSPTVSWVTTVGTGSQIGWQVRVTPAAATSPNAPIYDTGLIPGSDTSFQLPNTIPWTNGGSYKAWVRVADSALIGPWDDSPAATVSWTPPATPASITVTQGEPLTVTLTGLSTTASEIQLEWTLDGVTWTHAATVAGDGQTTRTIPVPLAEYDVPRQYRARIVQPVDGAPLTSGWRTTPGGWSSLDRRAYLVSQFDQADYVPVRIASDAARVDLEGVSVSTGLDAVDSRVDYSVSAGVQGETRFLTVSQADRDSLLAWLDAHREPFWIRWPAERTRSRDTYVHVPATLVARAAPRVAERLAQVDVQHRHVTFSWVSQEPE